MVTQDDTSRVDVAVAGMALNVAKLELMIEPTLGRIFPVPSIRELVVKICRIMSVLVCKAEVTDHPHCFNLLQDIDKSYALRSTLCLKKRTVNLSNRLLANTGIEFSLGRLKLNPTNLVASWRELDCPFGPPEEETSCEKLESLHSLVGTAIFPQDRYFQIESAFVTVWIYSEKFEQSCQIIKVILDRRACYGPAGDRVKSTNGTCHLGLAVPNIVC
jgi:hypothetical protein